MLTQCATINGNRAGNGQCHPDPFSGSGAKNAISSQVKTSNDLLDQCLAPYGFAQNSSKQFCHFANESAANES